MPPRYFTARASGPGAQPAPGHPVSHALDMFVLQATHTGASEWVVGFDDLGNLAAQAFAEATASVRAQLSFHEVAGGSRRSLTAAELYLFELQLSEQAAQSPGFDDPVYLYGTLLGPLGPGGVGSSCEGQLTVTRADVLEAAARGGAHAFRYPAPGGGSAGARAFHLLLPGDRPEELAQGRGIVLAYPVLAADVQAAAPGNEFFFNQILYDVISGLWSDVEREAPPPGRHPRDVPVPSRALVEQSLISEGFAIQGNQAVRRRKGLLGSVLDAFDEDRRVLPAEGHSDDYLQLAEEALRAIAGWPAPRARALRACLAGGQVHLPVPGFSLPPPPSPPPPPPPRPRPRSGPPAWMEDFIAAHQRPGGPRPVVTGASRPTWMSDFAHTPTSEEPSRPSTEETPDESAPRPDWMKDFDS